VISKILYVLCAYILGVCVGQIDICHKRICSLRGEETGYLNY
jgi:hypothetical protein